ncbi:MAG: hypothetical protein IKK48_00110 [Firmicutes bacterium]|nr:hypothetical protein [Bacillota bacterium]
MFSQRRKQYRNVILASVLTAVVLLSLVLLLGYLGSFKEEPYQETPNQETLNQETPVDETIALPKEKPAAEIDKEERKQTYYLLKYDNDVICVYFSDQQGNLTKLEETDIVYETLSPEDQMQFDMGIQVENRDSLNRILMDYES